MPLLLASGSEVSAALLPQGRVPFAPVPAAVDETALKQATLAEGASARDVAGARVEMKVACGAKRAPDRRVVGADRVFVCCEGALLNKPRDFAAAAVQLRRLRLAPQPAGSRAGR